MSCPSSTIFAYLGEFHNTKNRSKMIMCASAIYGISGIIGPIVAYYVINQKWQFYIPLICVLYKPWRAFIVLSSIPSFVCALAFFILPESPKYLLSTGNQEKAINILQKINRINNGKNVPPLIIGSIVDEMDSSYENQIKHKVINQKNPLSFIKLMWHQTIPLFMKPYLKKTLLLLTIQIFINISSNGFYIWVPEIVNRIVDYINLNTNNDNNISICEIMNKRNLNAVYTLSNSNNGTVIL